MKKKNLLFFALTILIFFVIFSLDSSAALVGNASQATLSFSPGSGTYNPNDTFSVDIYLNTNSLNIDTVAAYLNYDKASFQAISIDTTGSAFTMQAENSIDSNTGVIKITRGIPAPGIVNSANSFVAKINFKAIASTNPASDNLTFQFSVGDAGKSNAFKAGNVLLSGVYNGKYAVSGNVSPSPTPSPTTTPSPSPSFSPTPTPVPSQSPSPLPPILPGPGLPYANGSVLTSSGSDKIYFIINDQKRWLASPEVLLSYGLTSGSQITVSQTDLDKYTTGPDINIPSFPEGTLIRAKGDFKVYIIKPPFKRHIFNPAVFTMYRHFTWASVKNVDRDVVDSYITSDLYRSENDYRVYSLEEINEVTGMAIKHHINMTASQYETKGYKWGQIFIVNSQERDYYQTGGDYIN